MGLWVSNLSSGLLVLLVLVCLYEVGFQAITVIRLVAFPLGCGVAYTFIQLVLHEESLTETVRPFLIWMLMLFLVQLLVLRANFLHRFFLVMFFIGLAALPYLNFYQDGTSYRSRLDRAIEFGKTNEMGVWYGFCEVYFTVLAFTTKKSVLRILSSLIAIGCLYVVTLTVSRGALLAIAIATLIAGRHLLKNGFLPILLLACISWIVIELGVFNETAQFYSARGTEDTGRLAVWPLIIDSFLNSPWIGVGHANVGATPEGRHFVTPHNGILYIAQSSGIVPLALFIAYWLRAGQAAFQADVGKSPDAVFYLPLLAFTFFTINLGAFTFMQLGAIVSLAIPMTASVQRQALDLPIK